MLRIFSLNDCLYEPNYLYFKFILMVLTHCYKKTKCMASVEGLLPTAGYLILCEEQRIKNKTKINMRKTV